MSYLDEYRARVLSRGQTEQERNEYQLENNFRKYLAKSPGRTVYTHDGQDYDGVLISGTRTAAQSEKEIIFYLEGYKKDLMAEGTVFTTPDLTYNITRTWIVLNSEVHSNYGYIRYKILELDYVLKYVDKNGIVREAPAYVVSTLKFDIKEYFHYVNDTQVQTPYRALNIIWAAHPEIDKETEFMIGDENWRYVASDKISIKGVWYTTLYKAQIDKFDDSVERQLSNESKIGNTTLTSNYGDEIVIGMNTTDLKFQMLKDGRLVASKLSIDYVDEDSKQVILIEDGMITPLSCGAARIKLYDDAMAFSIEKTIYITPSKTNYFIVVGDKNIPRTFTRTWHINTDASRIEVLDNPNLTITLKDKTVKVIGQSVGPTLLQFKADGQTFNYPVEVVAPWK